MTQIERSSNAPTLMTIREVAATGLLSEYALRKMHKEGRLPSFRIGNKVLINYDMLLDQLNSLSCIKSDYASKDLLL